MDLSGLFKDVDWTKVLLGAGGQFIADRRNRAAAQTAQRGALANVQAQSDAAAQANARLERIAQEARPDLEAGAGHFRRILADDPDVLTPAQLLQLEDAKRMVVNSPVLRTSGRATTAAVSDLTRRNHAAAIEANRARRDRAASALVGRGNAAIGAQTGQANVDLATGRAAGQAMQGAADIGAQAQLAGGQSMVDVLSRVMAGGGGKYSAQPAPAVGATPAASAPEGADPNVAASSSPVSMLASIIADGDKDKYKSRYLREGAEV